MQARWQTSRLDIAPWHDSAADDLAEFLGLLLTPAVTASLPPGWGIAADNRPQLDAWIADRDAEGSVFLVADTGRPIGLLIVGEVGGRDECTDLRIGYLLIEDAWGSGFATELIAGFVERCREAGKVNSISAGVAAENGASINVLERAGLTRLRSERDGELMYRIDLPDGTGLVVRPQNQADIDGIRHVVAQAFESPVEADLVDRIRSSDEYVPEMELVAEIDGTIVGHVMVSGAVLRRASGDRPVAMLSPLAVAPDHQRRGIGAALIEAVVAVADERGEPAVVLTGDPAYYGRFEFVHSAPLGIKLPLPDWASSEAGQVRLLSSYDPDDPTLHGDIHYPAAFDGVD